MTTHRVPLSLFVTLSMLGACAGEPDAPGDSAQSDSATTGVTFDIAAKGDATVAQDADTEPADIAEAADGGASGNDTGGGADAAPAADTGKTADCPGGAGCACTANTDCDSALCIETPTGKQCAKPCVEDCPSDFACAQVTTPGGDVASICVPRYGRLCDPCTSSKECTSLGLTGSLCVDQGEIGAFCGVKCSLDGECPKGYGCEAVVSLEGTKSKQCVKKPSAGSKAQHGVRTRGLFRRDGVFDAASPQRSAATAASRHDAPLDPIDVRARRPPDLGLRSR